MIRTLTNIFRQDREKFVVPKSVQQAIPIQAIWGDGMFQVGKNKFAQTYKFLDINYAVASRADKEAMFLEYSELLNSFDSGATTKITINNRRLNRQDFEQSILIPMQEDGLDLYRKEYNAMLLEKATGANSMVQEKYVTVSVYKKSIEEARTYFSRVSVDLMSHFSRLGSKCMELDATDKLRTLHDFYRVGEETGFIFDLKETMKKGHSFKDFICPDSLEFEKDHFVMGKRYGRVLFLREYASYIKDSMIAELTDLNRNLMMSIDIIPVPTDEAVREVENRLLGVETNITNWQRRQNANNNYSAMVPYDMEQQRKESKEFLDDLTTRDQRMMFAVLTLVHTADTMEQLNTDTDALLTTARKHLCQFATLKYQQMDGLNTALPIGHRKINALRTLTTESLAVLMPFRVQEIMDEGGIYCGENAISHNLIMCNKAKLLNPNSFLLGVPGSGKSFGAKMLIVFLALATGDDILICDPEREYASLIEAMGGEVIRIAAGSHDHINAMDMVEGYGDGGNPVIDKSEFVLSLFEQLDAKGVTAKEKSLIDRCTAAVYEDYQRGGAVPTLCILREKMLGQPEKEAKDLALALELFTSGSLDAFAHKSNVDINSRMVVYDIMDLGKQLKTMGLLVITDAMLNRVTDNWRKGKRTHLFLDEFHVVFENEFSGAFFNSAWRRFRKRNAFPNAITQNVEYLLDSILASTMLSNSEYIVMLNQAASDRQKLADLLNISNEQMSYITNADAGCGLIKYGSSLVPFINKFPKNTRLYKLMTTKPGEDSANRNR
ncbi:VirB4-like conjugal transfer ATPase, CD1110 family [Faecalicatena contorta]|uniref:Type IV secretory pathway, VirB4 component n=1 Tax=Faecalicatena contorta TaxID=39482 RepID=A0A315ZSW3_9FIRM|nr:ATP-binding protein [Faecalicatena contorta]PWJ47824.1 type IV secretory pathway VirB4 component [Faecalicatena contorta]SUQ15818.1 Type IV secretory pathway, VirB4 component [Faecalicatena contorta]